MSQFADGPDWPDWAFALMSAIHHTEVQLMTKQDQLNADVQAISSALTGLSDQITDLKNQLAAQVGNDVDLSGLDALAAQAASLGSQVQAAGDTASSDAPASDPTADVQAAASGDSPADVPSADAAAADPNAVNPAPTL